jgi:homoserine O-acetyltransferase
MRIRTLQGYGVETTLEAAFLDPTARKAEIARLAEEWAAQFDANSLIILMKAVQGLDLRPQLGAISAKVLYVLSRTDRLFPPALAAEVMPLLRAAGVRAEYVEIDSPHGHFASGVDAALWAPALRRFMEELGTVA